MTFVHRPNRRPIWTLSVLVAAVSAWSMLALASPAAAGTPCYKQLINDWQDNGRIDKVYPTPCYKEALKKLPIDLRDYSSLPDDINRALLAATNGRGGGSSGGSGTKPPRSSGVSGQQTGTDGQARGTGQPGKPRAKSGGGVFRNALDWMGPKNADSIPLPLIILAALGLLLLAAGSAGFVARRIQSRRGQLRPAPAPRARPRGQ